MAQRKDKRLLATYRLPQGKACDLSRRDTVDETFFAKAEKRTAREALAEDEEQLQELQRVLFAQARHAVLVILQGPDTAGKDGTIRHVMGPLNPQGVRVSSFKKPNEVELSHDYLWRVHHCIPPRGFIGIFNRSHYEDILVPTVFGGIVEKELERRYRQIRDFERHLSENGVTLLKFYLHISKQEQKKRLQERLDLPHKNWKFDPDDLRNRARWSALRRAYERILDRSNRPWAPWYVIPADRKWYRDFLVGRILRRTLEGLNLRYPQASADLKDVTIED
jgi:PPK2 family polyphosphate:nucleotide phosphotransferase